MTLIFCLFLICIQERNGKDFSTKEHETTIIQPYIQLQGEKGNSKNNENYTVVTSNTGTNFMFDFIVL